MNIRRAGLFFVLAFFSAALQAGEIFDGCGISMPRPKFVSIDVVKNEHKGCDAKIEFLIKNAPPVLEDENSLKISRISIEQALARSEYFKNKNGHYELTVSHAIREPQYQLLTGKTRVKVIEGRNNKGLLGLEEVMVAANPSWLWPSPAVRTKAIRKYISKNGLVFDCFYGHLGVSGKEVTVTMSGCIPRSKISSDLSIEDIQKILESIKFEE